MTDADTPTRRCPSDGRPLEQAVRWLCPRCLHEHLDSPRLFGAPLRPTGHDQVGGRPINMKLGTARLAAVDAIAARRGIPRTRVLRELLDAALAHEKHRR